MPAPILNPVDPALARAIRALDSCDPAALARALRNGASPNRASPNGLSLTRSLFERIANPGNFIASFDLTPAQTSENQLAMIRVLMDAGADICSLAPDGSSDFHFAALHFSSRAFAPLIKEASHVDLKNRWGQTALHFAALTNKFEGAKALLIAGADVNAQDLDGDMPLHLALARRDPLMLELLINTHQASLSLANRAGVDPFALCLSYYSSDSAIAQLARQGRAREEARVLERSLNAPSAPPARSGPSL